MILIAGNNHGATLGADASKGPLRQEVKRTGRLPFVKKVGVRRPALRELFRPVVTPAEIRLFSELHQKHSSKTSTNWGNMCHEWNQRAALSVSHVSGADNAIHQKNIPLLKNYEKNLVLGNLGRDSLNWLHAHNTSSVQHTTPGAYQSNTPSVTHSSGGGPMSRYTMAPIHPSDHLGQSRPIHPSVAHSDFPHRGAISVHKNKRGGIGIRKRCRQGCGKLKSDCKCPRRYST
jgi:hypothetical protein